MKIIRTLCTYMLREVFVVHHTVSPSNGSRLRTAWLNMLRVVVDSDTQLKAFCEDALTASAVLPPFILADTNIADKLLCWPWGVGLFNTSSMVLWLEGNKAVF